jgi:hypothetical protein
VLNPGLTRRPVWRIAGALICVAAFSAALPVGAGASAPGLRVTNLGQSSAPVEIGQPPIDVVATNSCPSPFTLANESACPPGTWPPLGQPWGAIEDVAGGDTLRLEFSTPVSSVKVGSTSNYEPGLTDPDGKAIANYDVVPESAAAATADPAVWAIALPLLDAQASSTQGYTFSVVAQDESGYHDYPFGIRSPRFANESTKCGRAFYSTGSEQGLCGGGAYFPKAFPQVLRITKATYDGRVLALHLDVPEAGQILLGVPVACVPGRASCRKKTSISRHVPRSDDLVLRRRLSPRLDADHHLNLSVRLEMADGGLIIGSLRPKLHRIKHR